jgi:hypothetical protein
MAMHIANRFNTSVRLPPPPWNLIYITPETVIIISNAPSESKAARHLFVVVGHEMFPQCEESLSYGKLNSAKLRKKEIGCQSPPRKIRCPEYYMNMTGEPKPKLYST